MKQTKRPQGAALANAHKQRAKNPAKTTLEGKELTNDEAAALGLDPTQRWTFYFPKKKTQK